jgi:hypothetical protein
MVALPKSLERRSDIEAIRDDVAPYLRMRPEERSATMSALCRLAAEQLAARADAARLLAYQEPRSPQSLALWRRLIQAARRP